MVTENTTEQEQKDTASSFGMPLKGRSYLFIIPIVALAVGFFLGMQVNSRSQQEVAEVLEGSPKVVDSTLSFNRLLNKFPETYWEFVEGNGFAFVDPLVVVQWVKNNVPYDDTPSDVIIVVEFDSLPFEVELEEEEKCVFEDYEGYDPVCFYPPKGMPIARWPHEWPDSTWWYEPAMPADNPQHPGLAHPAFLAIRKNLEGPLEYPPYFEEKYPGLKLFP